MVEVRDLGGHLQQRRVERRENRNRVGDVLLREVAFGAGQAAGLEEHAIGQCQLADVVQSRRLCELHALDLREPHARADRLGEERHATAVIARARVAQIHRLHQRIERRAFDRVDRFGERVLIGLRRARLRHRIVTRAAQRDEVTGQRHERDRIDRLVEKGGGTAFERIALEFFIGRTGDHHDRHRGVSARAQFADEVDAAEFRHVLIDDDEHRIVDRAPGERVARFVEADRFGLGNLGDDLREDGQVRLDIVDYQDLCERTRSRAHARLAR